MTEQSIAGLASLDINSNSAPHASVIFVTGGTGLVGSHVIQQLLKEGRKVKALY
ncbi:MAG: dependent epimerase/dehydratase family, partial [Segetibacter sp.]|nr:dependent epimerase/dehydratase family [Segetibacter sp.]